MSKLNKQEKRHIRLQICELLDKHCRMCPERMKYRSTVCITVCPVSQEMRQLAAMLEESDPQPSEPVQEHAPTEPRRKGKWSREEVFYLWHHRRVLTIKQLADRLHREPKAVYKKLRQLLQQGGISDAG